MKSSTSSSPTQLKYFYDVMVWLSLVLFLAGGVFYQGRIGTQKIYLEISDWGFALSPIILAVLFFPKSFRSTRSRRLLQDLWAYLYKQPVRNGKLLAAAALLPIVFLYWRAMLNRYWSFAGGWDLAIYSQACSHRLVSSLRDETTLLADHFEPILALFVPFCQLLDAPLVLISAQLAAFAIGAWGIICLARFFRWSWPLALVAGGLYLMFTGNRITILYDFHPITFCYGVIPWLVLALLTGRYLYIGFLAVLLICLKETASLTLAGVGLWWVLNCRQRTLAQYNNAATSGTWIGVVLTVGGFLSFFVIMVVVFPYFRQGQQSQYFAKYYGYLGGSLAEVVVNLISKPWLALHELANWYKLKYVLTIFFPFLLAVWIRPIFLLPIIPALLVNMMSQHPYLASARFHYEAEIYPWLFSAGIVLSRESVFLGRWHVLRVLLKRYGRLNLAGFRTVWLVCLIGFFSGKSLAWYSSSYNSSHQHLTIRNHLTAVRHQWDEARVAAFDPLAPMLTNVRNLYLLDRWQDADWIVIAYPEGKGSWAFSLETIEGKVIQALGQQFELVYRDKLYPSFRIWRRKGILRDDG